MKSWRTPGTMGAIMRRHLIDTVHRNKGNLSHAAKELGVGRASVYRLVKTFSITEDELFGLDSEPVPEPEPVVEKIKSRLRLDASGRLVMETVQ